MGKSMPRSGRAMKVTSSTEARLLDHSSTRSTMPRRSGERSSAGPRAPSSALPFHKAEGVVAIVIEDEAENVFELRTVHRCSIGAAMRFVERVNRAARQLNTDA
jgi:hypothetical protein